MKEFVVLAAAIILVGIAFVLTDFDRIPMRQDFDIESLGAQMSMLLFIALILERSQEVIMTALRGAGGDKHDREVSLAHGEIAKREAELTQPGTDRTALRTELSGLREQEATAKKHQDAFRAETRRQALMVGVILGLITSLLGFRVLSNALDFDSIDPEVLSAVEGEAATTTPETAQRPGIEDVENQTRFIQLFDIILTGLLLAGGSDGIHKIARAVTDFAESASDKSKKSAAIA